MILRSLLAAGALALQVSAFLVPLEISEEVQAAKAQLESFLASQASQSQTIDLPCPGCFFAGPEQEDVKFNNDDENTIVSTPSSLRIRSYVMSFVDSGKQRVQFSIEDKEYVQIDGVTVFPLEKPFLPIPLTAIQIRTSDSTPSRPLPLGFALEVLPPVVSASEDARIVTLWLTILDLDGRPVNVDTIVVDTLWSPSGERSIAKITIKPFAQTPGAAECSDSLCRLRAIISARVRAILEAAKGRAQAAGAWVKGGCRGKNRGGKQRGQHHEHDAGEHSKGAHAHHHKMHRFGRLLHRTLRFFVIPALLGVIGGLMASAIGMLVGQGIVYLWFRFHRRGQRGNIRVVESAIVEEEKDALVEDGELPPRYDDVLEEGKD